MGRGSIISPYEKMQEQNKTNSQEVYEVQDYFFLSPDQDSDGDFRLKILS